MTIRPISRLLAEERGLVWRMLLVAICSSLGTSLAIAQTANSGSNAAAVSNEIVSTEALFAGLEDPSYRVRRESFLALCDLKRDISPWLKEASESHDRNKAAIATWLTKLRRTDGSMTERTTLMRDYEQLLSENDSVIDQYLANNQWDRLIELIRVIPQSTRAQLFREPLRRIPPMVAAAWASGNEKKVPLLLDLTLNPTSKVVANRRWRMLGMPQEWQLTIPDNMPSASVLALELDGKVDEAVEFARKKGLSNWIENLYIRNGRWDKWLELSQNSPMLYTDNLPVQRAAILMTLGRVDEARKLLEPDDTRKRSNVLTDKQRALIELITGNAETIDARFDCFPKSVVFNLQTERHQFRDAFELVGLNDLSLPAVQAWIQSMPSDFFAMPSQNSDVEDSDEIDPVQCGWHLHHLGLREQALEVDKAWRDASKRAEKALQMQPSPSSQEDFQTGYLIRFHRKELLTNWKKNIEKAGPSTRIRSLPRSKGILGRPPDPIDPFESVLRRLFPNLKNSYDLVYSAIYPRELNRIRAENAGLPESEYRTMAISNSVDLVDLLNEGRKPKDWNGRPWIESLIEQVFLERARSDSSWDSDQSVALEMSDLAETMGEPRLALDILKQFPNEMMVGRRMAELHRKFGEYDQACQLLLHEFEQQPQNLALMQETVDCLSTIGRWAEAERVRIQCLSSTTDPSAFPRTPEGNKVMVHKETQFAMEHSWERHVASLLEMYVPAMTLRRQYFQMALKDLSYASKAAHYARIELLVLIKIQFSNDRYIGLYGQSETETALSAAALEAIANHDRDRADQLIRLCNLIYPGQIETPIKLIPIAEKELGKDIADAWFDLYFKKLLKHLEEFPDHTLIGNNTAWLAAQCNRELPKAKELATHVTQLDPNPTYIDTLAEIEYRLGNVETALGLSQQCREVEPRDQQHRDQIKRFLNTLMKKAE